MAASDAEDLQETAYNLDGDVETTCKICHAEFLDVEDLNVHENQVHAGSARPQICQFCVATYTDLEDYAGHIRDDHLQEVTCCQYCTKCFTDRRKAKNHQKSHLGNESGMFSCSQCVGLFTTRKELEFHEVMNHDNKIDGVVLKCMPYLSSLLKLNAFAFLQVDYNPKVLICHVCEFTSTDLKVYIQHLEDDQCAVFICGKCGKVLKNRKTLKKHLKYAIRCIDPAEYAGDLTTCPTCKNQVHGKQMQAHLKLCKTYRCTICDIQLEGIDQLSIHQSQEHPAELDVTKCKYCPKEYVGQNAVDRHVERAHRHTFIHYKYKCKTCEAIFKHPARLFAHYFIKHKELEPYTCRICDMKFKIRKRFTIHIKVVHKGAGVAEFDDQYHVFFAEKKSENPFLPTCVVPELLPDKDLDNTKTGLGKQEKPKTTLKRRNSGVSDTEGSPEQKSLTVDENESDTVPLIKRRKTKLTKLKGKKKKKDIVFTLTSSEDEEAEPLLNIKKRAERNRFQRMLSGNKRMKPNSVGKPFTCKKCGKYCYTYQNYHNHLRTHSKNEAIDCVKCSKSFRTKKELIQHVSRDHATSKLIETLKSVRERKQVDQKTDPTPDDSVVNREETCTERFLKTIRRIKLDKQSIQAKIGPAADNSSVKKFIENFMPDIGDSTPREEPEDTAVVIKQYNSPFYRKRMIAMTKFTPEPQIMDACLKMPVKFTAQDEERVKLKVKLVQRPVKQSMFGCYEDLSYNTMDHTQDYDDYEDLKNDAIPDIAQEVMLEGTEEPPRPRGQGVHKIIFPKLPPNYNTIHIATLQSQAPYYKIIKIKGNPDEPIIFNNNVTKEDAPIPESPQKIPNREEVLSLADGTKFVQVNPLSHLLDKPVEEVLGATRNKYYKATPKDFNGLLADALKKMDKPKRKSRTKKSEI